MARIVHIAVKVEDREKATQFYENTFGFVEVQTGQVRDHTSRHLSDGTVDLALIKYAAKNPPRPAPRVWDHVSITSVSKSMT